MAIQTAIHLGGGAFGLGKWLMAGRRPNGRIVIRLVIRLGNCRAARHSAWHSTMDAGCSRMDQGMGWGAWRRGRRVEQSNHRDGAGGGNAGASHLISDTMKASQPLY